MEQLTLYLLFKLTGGISLKQMLTNASRTLLLNLQSGEWDNTLLDFFSLKKSFLPTVEDTFSDFGKTKNVPGLPDGIPIYCMIGDRTNRLS